MIGIYDYTVILTYLSVWFTVSGLWFAFNHNPFFAVICLMLSGLCDGFDGKVARSKKDRDAKAINYGIQIDSLADMMAYGILPVAIGYAVGMNKWYYLPIAAIYTLAALIRLAHFNVNEEEVVRAKKERHKTFIGLPTTSVSLILPFVFAFHGWVGPYFASIYAGALLVIAILFVVKLRFVDKPDLKKLFMWIVLGIIELIIMVVLFKLWKHTR